VAGAAGEYEHDPHGREMVAPSTFAVSATMMRSGRAAHGRGELLISPDSVAFAPFASTGSLAEAGEFTHTGRTITMTGAWRCPPWANTFLLLRHGNSHVRVVMSISARHRLKHSLRKSGMKVSEETSWGPPRLPAGR
jgi:hypothetical protein